jgi:hypothetical protein
MQITKQHHRQKPRENPEQIRLPSPERGGATNWEFKFFRGRSPLRGNSKTAIELTVCFLKSDIEKKNGLFAVLADDTVVPRNRTAMNSGQAHALPAMARKRSACGSQVR